MVSSKELTNRDKACLKAFFTVNKTANIDWKAVSENTSFTTAKYARDSFNGVKKKLEAGDTSLPPKQLELLKAVALNGTTSTVDWDAVAKAGEFKTAKYARDTWTSVKNKLIASSSEVAVENQSKQGAHDFEAVTAAKTKKSSPRKGLSKLVSNTSTPMKRKIGESGEDDNDEESIEYSPPLKKLKNVTYPDNKAWIRHNPIIEDEKEDVPDGDKDNNTPFLY